MTERIERRVLGAVRFLDATTQQRIAEFLQVRSQKARFVRNPSNFYVIASAAGLEEHEAAFQDPPSAPAVGSVPIDVQVSDPSGSFMGRQFTLSLPRDPKLAPANPDSLFHPVDVALYPSPLADVAPGWALVRASVGDKVTGTPLPGALVRVLLKSDLSVVKASGLADSRGEALVAVPGIEVTTFGADEDAPVTTSDITVKIEAIFDPEAGAWPDPDAIVKNKAALPNSITNADFKLASGGFLGIVLEIPVPADVIAKLKEKKNDA